MLQVLCQYLFYRLIYSLKKENRPIVIMPIHPKFPQVPRVILEVLGAVGRPEGSYPERFVSISLLLAEILAKKENRPIVIMPNPPKTYPTTQGHP